MADLSHNNSVVRGGALDALRFFASLFVVIFHFGPEAPVPLGDLHDVWSRGYLATDFFLMLSGFVLARAYGPGLASGRIDPLRFWLKRFARSYPTHIITLGLLVVLVLGATAIGHAPKHAENFPLSGIPAQILLLHVLGAGGGQWNIPAWTLSALLICYALMPWIWRALSRLPGPLTPLALAITILLAGQVVSLSLLGISLFHLPYNLALIRAFALFIVGLLVAQCVATGDWTPKRALMVAAVGGGLLLADVMGHGPDTLNLVAITLLTLGCGAYRVTRPLPGAQWGAKVSFSLFMTHTLTGAVMFAGVKPVLQKLVPALSGGLGGWLLWFATLGTSLIVADLYNRLIDAPLQKWIRARWFSKPREAQPHPASRPISS